MADIKNVYQVAEEMGNSPAMVKKHYFRLSLKLKPPGFGVFAPNINYRNISAGDNKSYIEGA